MKKVSSDKFDNYYDQIQTAIIRTPKLDLVNSSITWYYVNKSKGAALKITESSYNHCDFYINDN